MHKYVTAALVSNYLKRILGFSVVLVTYWQAYEPIPMYMEYILALINCSSLYMEQHSFKKCLNKKQSIAYTTAICW